MILRRFLQIWTSSFIVTSLAACGGGSGAASPPPPASPPPANLPVMVINGASLAEGDSGTSDLVFNVMLSAADAADVTVSYATADGSAVSGTDYDQSSGVLTLPGGTTQATIAVPVIGEICFEGDETFSVELSGVSANATIGTSRAIGTITNDDTRPVISIADSELPEGDSGSSDMPFVVSLDRPSCTDTNATYTSNTVTADGNDFVVASNGFVIPAGLLQTTVNVEILGDTNYETDETLDVNLEDLPGDIEAGDMEAFGTIRTDDLPPLLIGNAEITEGDTLPRIITFNVGLAGITNEISVNYATADLTATVADNDYTPQNGTLVIPAGEILATIEVEVIGDTRPEIAEEFLVRLSNLVGDAVLQPGLDAGRGKILDDDTPVVERALVGAEPAAVSEGDSGITPLTFVFSTNAPATRDIVIDYATSDVTATAGVDYRAKSGRVRISAGQTDTTATIDVFGDTDEEASEFLQLNLTLIAGDVELFAPRVSGTILDDDTVGPSVLRIFPASIFEGDSGSQDMQIQLSLNPAAASAVSIDYATRDVTALAGSDYDATSGTVTFAAGETLQTIPVRVHGDTFIEANETFDLDLSNLTGPALAFDLPPEIYAGRIETDDPFAMVSINDITELEGNSGTLDTVFTISIDAVAADPVTVNYRSADPPGGSIATGGVDYGSVNGMVSIAPGDTSATFVVQIFGDPDNEFDEAFSIVLDNISQNAEFADAIGTGRIVNDDGSPGWSGAQQLDQGGQDNILPRLAMNANGAAMAVWSSTTRAGGYESSRYEPGGGWSAHELVPDNASSQHYAIFVNDSGSSELVWTGGRSQHASHFVGSGWEVATEFDPASASGQKFPVVTGNAGGQMIAAWEEPFTATPNVRRISYSRFDPFSGSWSTSTGATSDVLAEGRLARSPRIALNSSGDALAVWLDTQPYASRFSAASGSWSAPQVLSIELFPGFHGIGTDPQVAFNDNGDGIAVWDDFIGVGVGGRGNLWASHYDALANSWSEAIQLETVTVDTTNAQIAMDPAGNAFVVWLQDNNPFDPWNDSFAIWARRYDAASQTWEAATLVQDSDTRVSQFGFYSLVDAIVLDVPKLAVDTAGNAMLVWSENINGEFRIRASRYDISATNPEWGPQENISGDAFPFAIFPNIAVDAAGNIIVVWQAGDGERFQSTDIAEVWANRYTPP